MMKTVTTKANGKSLPKYLQLSEKLKQDINEGVYPRGSQLPGGRELAAILGISYLTVSNVLQALETDGYVKRIHGRGTFVTSPQAVPAEDKMRIAYLIDVHVSIFGKLFAAISGELNGEPMYNVPLHAPFGSGTSIIDGERWLEDAMMNRYHSIVIYGDRHFPYRYFSRYLPEIEQLNIIIFDNCAIKFPGVNRILSDVEQAGYLAARRFLKNGRQKLAVLSLQLLDDMYRRRYGVSTDDHEKLILDGIERAYAESGHDFFDLVRVIAGPRGGANDTGDFRFNQDLRKCFEDGYEAYFAIGDSRAPAVYQLAKEFGLKVGKDIAVLGFLNNVATCELLNPRLSSISINETQIGCLTARAIQENWRNQTVLVKPELIIRESDGQRC